MSQFVIVQATDPQDPIARWGVAVVNERYAGVISYHQHKEHAEHTAVLNKGSIFSLVRDDKGNVVLPDSLAGAIANFNHLPTEG